MNKEDLEIILDHYRNITKINQEDRQADKDLWNGQFKFVWVKDYIDDAGDPFYVEFEEQNIFASEFIFLEESFIIKELREPYIQNPGQKMKVIEMCSIPYDAIAGIVSVY